MPSEAKKEESFFSFLDNVKIGHQILPSIFSNFMFGSTDEIPCILKSEHSAGIAV